MASKNTNTALEAAALALSFVRAVSANDEFNMRTIKNTVGYRSKGFSSVFKKEVAVYSKLRKYAPYAELIEAALLP